MVLPARKMPATNEVNAILGTNNQVPMQLYLEEMKKRINAEKLVEMLKTEKADWIKKNNLAMAKLFKNYEKYELALGMKSCIETLECLMWPVGKKCDTSRIDKWKSIVCSNEDEFKKTFTIQMLRGYISESFITSNEFITTVNEIYNRISDMAIPDIGLSKDVSDDNITDMLDLIGMPSHSSIICTIKILTKKY